jgi:hypothetical protein
MKTKTWPDLLGMIAALACSIHCAALTAIFALYPTLWMKRKYWDMGLWQKLMWLEWSLLGLAWLLLFVAMAFGWSRHRHCGPGLLGLAPLALMSALILTPLHFSGTWTSFAAVAAGLLVALAHGWNLRLARRVRGVGECDPKRSPGPLRPRPRCGPPA